MTQANARSSRAIAAAAIFLAVAVFAGAMSMRVLDALLPTIARHYGHSVGTVGAAVTAYAISYSGLQLFYGPLGDRMGPLRVVAIAAFCSGLAAMACAAAGTLEWLVALRFVAGGVAAGIGPLAMAWVGHATSPDERAVVIARMTAASILGTTAGQAGGGALGVLFGWESAFLGIGAAFILSGIGLAAIGRRAPGLATIGRADRGTTAAPGFLALLARPAIRVVLLGVVIEGFAMSMSFTYIAAHLEQGAHLGPGQVSLLIALFGAGGVAFVISVRLLLRLDESARAGLGGAGLALGYLALLAAATPWAIGAALFIMGVGFFMLHNIFQVRATRMAPDATGAGISLFAATFFLGQALGASFGGAAFDRIGAAPLFAGSAALLSGLAMIVSRRARAGS